MKKHIKQIFLLIWMALTIPAGAQWPTHESVLNEHTWYKIGVTEDGVYAIDYNTLQSLGVDMNSLNPNQIRLFGNVPCVLPERNSLERYDDLSEIAIEVTGADDGSFDAQDQVRFYGKSPVNMALNGLDFYSYEPNLYTDTVFYFLCVDGGMAGLRLQENPSISTVDADTVINKYPDYLYHDHDEFSPYASGRNWYGDLITAQEGSLDFVFDIPGLDTNELLYIESNVLGRGKPAFNYHLKVNDYYVVNAWRIEVFQDHEYGKEHRILRSFRSDSERITVHYEVLPPEGANPMLFNEFFVLNFWRELRFRGQQMAFRIIPLQMAQTLSKVEVRNMNSNVECWDVTDMMRPCKQPMTVQSGIASFGVVDPVERKYQLFEPSHLKSVASCYPIANQNLHGITNAELLIITPRVFWDQSAALADFHREKDAMNCVLADIQEIYNEFGTGINDPTALRDFIRMVYLRSQGNLKYVLFMGKGTHDYRDIKGLHNNFVPTYEMAASPFLEVNSMCSDDYFALMDEDEGLNCDGKVDLGIGRIPITTPEQGDAVVAKIRHYADLSATHGIWKNNHLLMADNDSKTYIEHAETLAFQLDTSWRVAITKKLYLDSYPIISTPSGDRIPEAHDNLMDYFDKGVGVFSYTGHGGTKSLSSEWVLAISDILALDNYDRLPFIHTATCEFSKFDNPNIVSGGELLLLNANGGAIALLTTMRPTLAQNNKELSKSLHDHLYDKIDHQPLRFGDIFRLTKSDPRFYKKTNIVYVLFGDPALRFAYPAQEVKTVMVDGTMVIYGTAGVEVSGMGTIEGYVAGIDMEVDTAFNGVLEIKVYDAKSKYTTLGNYGNVKDYSFYNDVLFEGRASVEKGHFSVEYSLPSDINHGEGMGCVSYYAYDSIRNVDANGVFDKLIINAPTIAETDNQGPEIKLYWNRPDFENGDVVLRKGTLYADLFDDHGIYHYNVSIGRDIVLHSNYPEFDNIILNDWFEPALDDYRRGRVAFPIDELEDGTYEFRMKAWDTQNNSSEAEIVFEVRQGAIVTQARNFPNPFTDETWFTFNHGDMTDHLSAVIEVFDVMGNRVAMIERETDAEVGVVAPIRWDGSALRPGVYLFRITVTNSEGKTRTLSQRMVKK